MNGLSTSLPATVQLDVLRSVPGLEAARMTRAGYAIEYDYYPPTQLDATLQVKALGGLFFAGQINGTTGYEEAAGQGVVAGLNAARRALGRSGVTLGRESSYIGVLIDDLVTRGVDEPYRLFTSRSEFRLTVRQDNAIRRLAPIGLELDVYHDDERAAIERRLADENEALRLAEVTSILPTDVHAIFARAESAPLAHSVKIAEVAKRQGVSLSDLFAAVGVGRSVARRCGDYRRVGAQVRRLFCARARSSGEDAADGTVLARRYDSVHGAAIAVVRVSTKAECNSSIDPRAGRAYSRRQSDGPSESRHRDREASPPRRRGQVEQLNVAGRIRGGAD